ncbi:MAG: TIGR02530 family flagellar biosynthesis protein [Halanaerobiales bacterium]|nr:TIGR02530 family flagellar biosynthesis protein [Halanaerobiales bacterium]
MDYRLNINQPVQPLKRNDNNTKKAVEKNDNKSFKDIFNEQLEKNNKLKGKEQLSFSKHARRRVESRSIPFSRLEMEKLQSGTEKARAKGSRDSLIMVNNTAYIVSVENNKVITAVDEDSMSDNVFTNIDSAVFMK